MDLVKDAVKNVSSHSPNGQLAHLAWWFGIQEVGFTKILNHEPNPQICIYQV